MKRSFGVCADGRKAYLYTITGGGLRAQVCDLGATLVRLYVPDGKGCMADVVLGYDTPDAYVAGSSFFGATVGRNANRVKNAAFSLNGNRWALEKNEGNNNLHSGFDPYKDRLWQVISHTENSVRLYLESPHGDQGFPGNAQICVTYTLEPRGTLRIAYDGVADADTVFNMTNHSYFNLAGHDKPERAMDQLLTMPGRCYSVATDESIPTGELEKVAGTPMDFRITKALGKDIDQPYPALELQRGYDHNYEVFANPCATLQDPVSGRTMAVYTDCPGVQLYTGNFLDNEPGKDGIVYCRRGGVCLETQFYPDAVNNRQWKQPFVGAGERYHSETKYVFFNSSLY